MKLSANERELCRKVGFDQEVFALTRQACPGAQVRQLNVAILESSDDGAETYAEDFEPGPGLSVRAGKDEDVEELAEAIMDALPEGYLALCSEDADDVQAEVAVLRTDDPYDLLRLKATSGERFGLTTPKIIDRLHQWDRDYGVVLLGAAYDWVEFEFEALPSELDPLIAELLSFCPDLLEEGFNNLGEEMAAHEEGEMPEEFLAFVDIDFGQPGAGELAFRRTLQEGGSVYLWWD